MPLYDAHRVFVLGSRVVHADETPIALLDPGGGKTKKACMWAYARGAFEAEPGVVFDFCAGRGGQYPCAFLKGWAGTLVVDAYSGYAAALSLDGRSTSYCLAHARRRFDELVKARASVVGERAAVVMSLLQSAKLNGHEPWAYLKDVLTRLPAQLNSRIEELLPHKWQPVG